jgi:predicted Rossmann fold nucleotide-binding protein DprA/Smf involved in DNA uptake/predicted RNA methylase
MDGIHRQERDSAAADSLALTVIKGLGDAGVARILALVRREGLTIQDFLHSAPEYLQARYGLRPTLAKSLAGQVEHAINKAAELAQRADQLGIVVLVPGNARYPLCLHGFYGDEPPLLYACGQVALLDAPCVALVNSAKAPAQALENTLGLASRLAEAGRTLVCGAESPSYNVVASAAKRTGGNSITVMHHGLFAAIKSGLRREPAPLARSIGAALDSTRSLLISPFRLDGRWQKGNGPRRDRLVVGLAESTIAVNVRVGGAIERLCRQAIGCGRRVFMCQAADSTKNMTANESLLAAGAAPLVADSIGSNVDMVLSDGPPLVHALSEQDELERRRSLGQFFTPLDVARFIWEMAESLHGEKWSRTARVVDPACGEGVFLHVAIERGHDPQHCFGFDVDETLVPEWQHQKRLRGARIFRTNGLFDNPTVGLTHASFDLVIGNPPFSGRGLRHLLQLVQPAANAAERQRSWFDEEPDLPPPSTGNGADTIIARHGRAILDHLARQLSRYICWRLRDESEELCDAVLGEGPSAGLFANLDLSAGRLIRAADYERMAKALAEWPTNRPLDTRQSQVRDVIRRIASTAIEVYFTERFVQLAKPDGMIAVIVPEGILASDSLAPLRMWLMEQIQLLAVIGLPQKVFTGVGAKAKTGIVFARRYTVAERAANAEARSGTDTPRLAPGLRGEKVLMAAPDPAFPNWSLQKYLSGILEGAALRRATANAQGKSK